VRRLAAQARAATPLGPITLAATERGLAGLWFDGQRHHPGALDAPRDASQVHIAQGLSELHEYWRGERRAFTVALDAAGTPFQRAVWAALAGVAHGRTTSYGAIARALGRAQAVRAVGAAVGRNPLGIIVP